MKVTTGFGYIKDAQDNIVAKYVLPKGEHPLKPGYTYVEVIKEEELGNINIYTRPKNEEELMEEKIQNEIKLLTRKQALESLKQKGEL